MVSRYVYVARNAWEVRGVVYTNEGLAQDAARKAQCDVHQLFRKLDNPDFKGECDVAEAAELD